MTTAGVDLGVDVGGLALANPVMVAAGCAGAGRELAPYVDLAALGALVTRSVTLDPRAGGPPPRTVETSSGLLSDTGLQGPGLQGFLATELPWLAQQGARTVVSIAGGTLAEFAELARRVGGSPGVAALEVNLGWPPDTPAGRDSYQAAKIVTVVRRDTPRGVPVLVKLAPDVHSVVDVTRGVVKAGASAVVLAHGLPGFAVDPDTLRPALGSGAGRLSGPAVHAVALRCLWEVHRTLPDVPLIGCGGVRTGADAVAMLAAGATAVQVGSVVLHDPSSPARIATELAAELQRRSIPSAADLTGRAHLPEGDLR